MNQQRRQRPRNNGMIKSRNGKGGGNEQNQMMDGRSKGQLTQLMDRYLNLGRESQASGDRITAEGYFQHAEHYYRLIKLINDQQAERQQRPQPPLPPAPVAPADPVAAHTSEPMPVFDEGALLEELSQTEPEASS